MSVTGAEPTSLSVCYREQNGRSTDVVRRPLTTQRRHNVTADCRRDRRFHSVLTGVDLHRAAWLQQRPDCIMD